MSYAICHMQKFTAGAVKGIEIHNQRTKEGVSHSNPDIDWSKSDLNYDLHNLENQSYHKIIKNRISQLDLKKAVRKDAIVMCNFIITSDKEYFDNKTPQEVNQYFLNSYDFLKNRYGTENIISATIHLDETTPHMHFSFVPVTSDGRLSAKSIFTRSELNNLQTDFYKAIGEKHGLERGIEGSTAKHIEITRLKAQTANKELELLQKQQKALHSSLEPLQDAVKSLSDLEQIQGKKSLLGGNITLSDENFQKLHTQGVNGFKTKYSIEHKNNILLAENKLLKEEIESLELENSELEKKKIELEKKYNDNFNILKKVSDAFTRNPNLKAEYQKTRKIIIEEQTDSERKEKRNHNDYELSR